MSTLQFPKNPSINDEYDWEGFKYVYDGQKWKTIGVGYNPVNDLKDKLEPRIDELEDDVTQLQSGNSSLVQAVNSLNVRVTAEEKDTKDWEVFTAELLAQGGVPDNGQPDEIGNSKRVDAINSIIKKAASREKFDDFLVMGRISEATSVTVIGDSITQGIFSGSGLNNTQFFQSYLYRTFRSIFNAGDRGFSNDRGRMYETNGNLFYGAWFETGMPGNGGGVSSAAVTFPNTGVVEKELSIPAGEWIEIKLREIGQIGFFYDGSSASHTATSASVAINGVATGTLTTTATAATSHSGFVTLSKDTSISDTVRITAVGGTLIISGFTLYKTSTVGVRAYSFGWSGRSFNDFNVAAKLDAISTMSNFGVSASQRKLIVIALGSNSIYQAGRAQTPSAYIASLDSLISGLRSRSTNTSFLITVPPRANPALHNVEVGGGVTYEDYVEAIVDYAKANYHGVVRYDLSAISKAPYGYYSDGLHPNANGHEIMASELCDTLGVPYDNYVKTIDFSAQVTKTLVYEIDAFPGSGGAPTIKWQDVSLPISRVRAVRLVTAAGVEIPAEALWDQSTSCGMYWQTASASTTRFFYPNTAGFVRSNGYHVTAGLVTAGKPTGYKIAIDYI